MITEYLSVPGPRRHGTEVNHPMLRNYAEADESRIISEFGSALNPRRHGAR